MARRKFYLLCNLLVQNLRLANRLMYMKRMHLILNNKKIKLQSWEQSAGLLLVSVRQ